LEQTFKAANFYSTETDLSVVEQQGPSGTPAVIAGSSYRGPAFVPVTVATSTDFITRFGDFDRKRPATLAAREFLRSAKSLTFIRTLGAGANATSADVQSTLTTGRVKNAGFKLEGVVAPADAKSRHCGCVQFLSARHRLTSAEAAGYPLFTRNSSFTTSSGYVNLVRGVIMTASGSRVMLLDGDESLATALSSAPDDVATVVSGAFKLIISSSDPSFGSADGFSGVRAYSASLDPSSQNYVGKLLNASASKFGQEQHVLWADYAVDAEIASAETVAILSGSGNTAAGAAEAGLSYRRAFGAFDTRFKTPTTPWFISQPFGGVESELFRVESIDDGENANTVYKITIRDVQASIDDTYQYGTFTVQVRDWNDSDVDPRVLEQYPLCSLDPSSEKYVSRVIGDRRVMMNFDAALAGERRLSVSGQYDNVSSRVRVIVSDAVARKIVSPRALPFGFRGISVLKTTDSLADTAPSSATARITGYLSSSVGAALSGSVIPPIPFRQKLTRGLGPSSPAWLGQPAPTESVLPSLTWGVKFERSNSPLNANVSQENSRFIAALTRFSGIAELDVLVTGSGADRLCNNKFSLANVVFSNGSVADVTASADVHIREAAYWRDAKGDASDGRVLDPTLGKRVTAATLLASGTPQLFNKFSNFLKFTTVMFGGFDGLNVLDPEDALMSDKASSFDALGGASSGYVPTGFSATVAGAGSANNVVSSLRAAVDIATDPTAVDANVFCIPGIRESFITDYAAQRSKTNAALFYVMDVPAFSSDSSRLFATSTKRPSVDKTATQFAGRAIDNSYAAAYFPDVFMLDDRDVSARVPASVAMMGVLATNDHIAFPWSAPAGYNRALLQNVSNSSIRMSEADRDRLSDVRINMISKSPDLGWAVTGQKTLQLRASALDRVNVRRMLVEIKRKILQAARKVTFEQNDAATRSLLKKNIDQTLGFVKAQAGVEDFIVTIDDSNNTQDDIDLNKMNCSVAVVPTRSIEYVVISFIVTRSGVIFV